MTNYQSVVYPQRKLTYEEWIDVLKKEQNVNVSGLYKGRSIEERVAIDEARQYKIPQRVQSKGTGTI